MISSWDSVSSVISPMDSVGKHTMWIEPQQQLGAYVAWVNSQLKKKPGVHLVEDLRNDMRDGVIFADIIEIVAKKRITGIYEVPATYEEMRHNIELVLKFMTANHIKMHRIHATDIVEGNLKAVMRLILALAAHYKPMSVRHSTSSSPSCPGSRRQSVMDIAQGASAALTEARRNAKKAGKRSSRYVAEGRHQESSCETCSDSDQPHLQPSQQNSLAGERRQVDGCSADNSPVTSCQASPRSSLQLSYGNVFSDGQEGDGTLVDTGIPAWDDDNLETLKTLKKQLLLLQDLMLENSMESRTEGEGGESPTMEDWVLLKSRLQQATLLNEELREEISTLRSDCRQLQGTKAGLQQRLGEQDAMLSQLKSDKLHLEIELQTVARENESLRKEARSPVGHSPGPTMDDRETRDQTISYLRGELVRRERMISRLHQEITQQEMPVSDHVQLRRSCPVPDSNLTQKSSEGKTGDNDETLIANLRPASTLPRKNMRGSVMGEDGEGPKTWVIYFTDGCEQPATCVIPGRLGEIRLRDFKKLFEESDRYRYHFKALDPEYGTVKEELTKEDAVVPGWEDKIVAWVDSESGTSC